MINTLDDGTFKKREPNGARATIRINYKKVVLMWYIVAVLIYVWVGVFQLPQESHIREEVPLRSYRGNRIVACVIRDLFLGNLAALWKTVGLSCIMRPNRIVGWHLWYWHLT